MAGCQAMMQQRQQMQTRMRPVEERLGPLVSEMNEARREERVDRMAAVVTEMVAQRKAMGASMVEMGSAMMGHMAGHIQQGGDALAHCPMMKGMMGRANAPSGTTPPAGTPGPATDDHAGHH